MGQRRIGQASLAEALLPVGAGANRRLERIVGLIDWAPMGRLLAPPTGRPGYPPLAPFRALLLAQWYQLSDPSLEEALAARLSFRRFCAFGTPKRSYGWCCARYRGLLRNVANLHLICTAMNLRRAERLVA